MNTRHVLKPVIFFFVFLEDWCASSYPGRGRKTDDKVLTTWKVRKQAQLKHDLIVGADISHLRDSLKKAVQSLSVQQFIVSDLHSILKVCIIHKRQEKSVWREGSKNKKKTLVVTSTVIQVWTLMIRKQADIYFCRNNIRQTLWNTLFY